MDSGSGGSGEQGLNRKSTIRVPGTLWVRGDRKSQRSGLPGAAARALAHYCGRKLRGDPIQDVRDAEGVRRGAVDTGGAREDGRAPCALLPPVDDRRTAV